jgi:hypothetical protein
MAGGVMTTGQANGKGRIRRRYRPRRLTEWANDHTIAYGQDFARLAPGGADRLRQAMIATGSMGAASPPNLG